MDENEDPNDILKLLKAAAQRYEDNFVELVDFTKLVDVYAQAATISLKLNDAKAAKEIEVFSSAIPPWRTWRLGGTSPCYPGG